MKSIDRLRIFTIPKWLPNHIPPEIWSIIFYWKWILEIKIVNKELIIKKHNIDIKLEFCPFTREWGDSGNAWYKWYYHRDLARLNLVYPRCGIELLHIPILSQFRNKKNLHKHLTENIGIKCAANLEYNKMLGLLRTV